MPPPGGPGGGACRIRDPSPCRHTGSRDSRATEWPAGTEPQARAAACRDYGPVVESQKRPWQAQCRKASIGLLRAPLIITRGDYGPVIEPEVRASMKECPASARQSMPRRRRPRGHLPLGSRRRLGKDSEAAAPAARKCRGCRGACPGLGRSRARRRRTDTGRLRRRRRSIRVPDSHTERQSARVGWSAWRAGGGGGGGRALGDQALGPGKGGPEEAHAAAQDGLGASLRTVRGRCCNGMSTYGVGWWAVIGRLMQILGARTM